MFVKQVIYRSMDLLFVLFIHERHLDMFNKMSFLHKMFEAFVMTFWNVQHSISEQIKVVVIVLTILLFFFH